MLRTVSIPGGLVAALLLLPPAMRPAVGAVPADSVARHSVAAGGDSGPENGPDSVSDRRADAGAAPVVEWSAGGVTALGALVALDVPVRRLSRELQGSTGDVLARRARWFGNWHKSLPWFIGTTVAVGGLTGGLSGLEKAVAVLAGAAAGSAANEVVNELVGRARPLWDRGEFSFRPLSGHASFPSGHAAYTFAMAGAIDEATHGWIPAVAAYTVASATALSRVYDDKHWLSDIVVGAAIGTTVSHLATHRVLEMFGQGPSRSTHPDARAPGSPPGLRAHLIVTPGVIGVGLRF